MRLFILCAFSCILLITPVNPLWADDKPAPNDPITVIVTGTGVDEAAALKQALNNAVQQAVGVIVDAETVVKDDQIIKDQILTASNAIVTKYDPVGKPETSGGLVMVKIKAQIERKALTERLAKANVSSKAVEGKDLFAQIVTDLQNEKDQKKIIERLFDGFPGNVMKAEPVGEPRIIAKTDAGATVGITVRIGVDMEKYAKWQTSVVPVLSKLATKTETVRWNPDKDGAHALSQDHRSFRPQPGCPAQIPKEQLASSYAEVSGKWVPKAMIHAKRAVVIVERQGSSKAIALVLDPEGPVVPLRAPLFEVSLKDHDGKELDGQEEVLMSNNSDLGLSATPFWGTTGDLALPLLVGWHGKPQLNRYLDLQRGYADGGFTLIIFPYMAVGREDSPVACSAITHEFVFKLTLDQLSKLKAVEAKVQNATADEK